MKVRQAEKNDFHWISEVFKKEWTGEFIITRGKKHYPKDILGLIAEEGNKKVGLLTYEIVGDQLELTSLNSFKENQGIGSVLIKYLTVIAKNKGCKRIWVITENSNLKGLRFYQKRGFVLKAVYPNVLEQSRKIKPEIPKIDENGIPIRDEIELEYII